MGEQQIREPEGQSQEYLPVLSSGFSVLETPLSLHLSSKCVVEGGGHRYDHLGMGGGKGGME